MDKELSLLNDIDRTTEKYILPIFESHSPLSPKKYAQLRLFGLAYIHHKDIGILLAGRSIQSAELLLRTLIETYINYSWIGIGPGSKNFYMFVVDDNNRMGEIAQNVISYIKRSGDHVEFLNDAIDIKKINRVQADACLKSTKFLDKSSKSLTLAEKVQQLDNGTKHNGGFEWLYRFPYNFTHHAVHGSNRQLNRMLNDDTGEIELVGSKKDCGMTAGYANGVFLGFLEDFCNDFEIEINTEDLWEKL